MLADPGTPEAAAKRLLLCNGSGRPELAASLSGILLAHDLITGAQHAAAERFAKARAACFGVPLASRSDGREASEDRLKRLERAYNAMCARLSEDQHLAVVDVALELWPGWLRRQLLSLPLTGDDEAERQHLLDGLDALAGYVPAPRRRRPRASRLPQDARSPAMA